MTEYDYGPGYFELKMLPTPFILGSVSQGWRQLSQSTPSSGQRYHLLLWNRQRRRHLSSNLSTIGYNVYVAYHWMSAFMTTEDTNVQCRKNNVAQLLMPSISIQDVSTHYTFLYPRISFFIFSAVLLPLVISATFNSGPFSSGMEDSFFHQLLEWTGGLTSLSKTYQYWMPTSRGTVFKNISSVGDKSRRIYGATATCTSFAILFASDVPRPCFLPTSHNHCQAYASPKIGVLRVPSLHTNRVS